MTNMLPSEQASIKAICAKAIEGKTFTPQSKRAVATEILERLYDAGFYAEVRMQVGRHRVTGQLKFIPEVTIVDRVTAEGEHDYDRHRHEVQAEYAQVAGNPDVRQSSSTAMPGKPSKLWTPGGNA
jgi:hypothetical protein